MSIALLFVLILIAALLVFGVIPNISLVTTILSAAGFTLGEFLIGTFLLLFVFVIIAFALTYRR